MNVRILAAAALLVTAGAVGHAATAGENWDNLCARCHGPDGKGQTKVGKKMKLKDYTDAKIQQQLTDEEMAKAIADGVKDQAGKERMKGYKDQLSQQDVNELVGYIRKMKKG